MMERDFRNQRMVSIYLTAVGTIWLMLLWMDGMVSSVDMQSCYYSSSRDEYSCWKTYNRDVFWIAGLILTIAIPITYLILYYPQVKFLQWKDSLASKEIIREVEVVREVYKNLPMPPNPQGVVIKNYNVKDGVVTEE
jgi:SNF family Na+-dependent transporter